MNSELEHAPTPYTPPPITAEFWLLHVDGDERIYDLYRTYEEGRAALIAAVKEQAKSYQKAPVLPDDDADDDEWCGALKARLFYFFLEQVPLHG
jgi:hypothetical protein